MKTETCFAVGRIFHILALVVLFALPVSAMFTGPIALAWFFGFLALTTVGSQFNRTGRIESILELVNEVNEHNANKKAGNTA